MNQIKFSHEYTKMPFGIGNMGATKLLEVLIGDTDSLHESFVKYDTRIKSNYIQDSYYRLPKGKVIVLLLVTYPKNMGAPRLWTTIRRYTPEKETYYRNLRGQEFKIIIEGKYAYYYSGGGIPQ